MQGRPCILSFGHDVLLQALRAKVLETSAYTVAQTSTLATCKRTLVSGHYDLLLLCHTVHTAERHEVEHYAAQVAPHAAVLALANNPSDERPLRSERFLVSRGPEKLIAKVQSILQTLPRTTGD